MREIKFKGFDKRDKKIKCISDINFDAQGKIYSVRFAFEDEYTLIDDVELMQFTGLKDKNGVEIYEGDIVTFSIDDENSLYEIIFNEEYAGFEAKCIKSNDIGMVGKNSGIFTGRVRAVVGNIYENPELLERK